MATKKKTAEPAEGPGHDEVEEQIDEEQAEGAVTGPEGFVDPTPNENYTVAGVTSGKPTPETDAKASEKAKAAAKKA